jgi:hypothetical protein
VAVMRNAIPSDSSGVHSQNLSLSRCCLAEPLRREWSAPASHWVVQSNYIGPWKGERDNAS